MNSSLDIIAKHSRPKRTAFAWFTMLTTLFLTLNAGAFYLFGISKALNTWSFTLMFWGLVINLIATATSWLIQSTENGENTGNDQIFASAVLFAMSGFIYYLSVEFGASITKEPENFFLYITFNLWAMESKVPQKIIQAHRRQKHTAPFMEPEKISNAIKDIAQNSLPSDQEGLLKIKVMRPKGWFQNPKWNATVSNGDTQIELKWVQNLSTYPLESWTHPDGYVREIHLKSPQKTGHQHIKTLTQIQNLEKALL